MSKKKFKKSYLVGLILVLLIIIFASVAAYKNSSNSNQVGKLDNFAQCLKTKGVIFYGAFWCPHCQNQKALFGSSQKYLPYFECSTPDANGQLAVCTEKNISGYPTWVFPDGSIQPGEVDLNTLAQKSGCTLPQ